MTKMLFRANGEKGNLQNHSQRKKKKLDVIFGVITKKNQELKKKKSAD